MQALETALEIHSLLLSAFQSRCLQLAIPCDVSPDGSLIAMVDGTGRISVHNRSNLEAGTIHSYNPERIQWLQFTRSGSGLISQNMDYQYYSEVAIWEFGKRVATSQRSYRSQTHSGVSPAPDETYDKSPRAKKRAAERIPRATATPGSRIVPGWPTARVWCF